MEKWTRPDSYAGADWPDYYMFMGQHRDSDTLTRSNFTCALKALGGEDLPQVIVVRESHWAVGWVEWIAIHEKAITAIKTAEDIETALEDYPIVNEDHWSEVEQAEACEVWANCYDWQERIKYMREYSSQFEFPNFACMISCVRGEYFAGYPGELIQ